MVYKVSPKHLNLLSQFTLTEHGFVSLDENMLSESSMPIYIVSMWVSSFPVEIRIGTHGGSGTALAVARKLFPKCRAYSAKSA